MANKTNVSENENVDRVDSIKLTDNDTGKSYELDFSRESVKFAEARGFKLDDVTDFPTTLIPDFFFYSFRMHHKNVSRSQTDALLEKMGGLSPKILERLILLYHQTALSHIVTTDEDMEKNSTVTVEM